MSIVISEKAKKELVNLGVGDGKFLRIEVVPGGCSGMTYSAAIDDAAKDDDKLVLEEGALQVYASEGSTMFLDGLSIDYSDDLIQSGFRFNNPSASKSCGCGASFKI